MVSILTSNARIIYFLLKIIDRFLRLAEGIALQNEKLLKYTKILSDDMGRSYLLQN